MNSSKLIESIVEEFTDFESMASDFVETEIGMFDFVKNWELYKKSDNWKGKILAWMCGYTGSGVDSILVQDREHLINCLDSIAKRGGWVASFLA